MNPLSLKKKRKFPQYEILLKPSLKLKPRVRLVGARDAGGTMSPTYFDRSVNPISTRERSDYAHHITAGPPRFSDFPTTMREKKNVVNTCDDM